LFRDVAALHEKLERTRNLAKENEAAKGSFQETFTARVEQLLASLADHEGVHAAGCAQLADRISGGLAQNVAALGRLAGLMDQLGAAGGTALTSIEDSVRTHGLEATR
jgi:hypothetical protein